MDFNIVTFHTAYNHGAVLQTYALQEFIIQLGYSAGIYDYRPPFTNSYTGIKGKLFRTLRRLNEKEYIEKEKRFQEFVKSNLNLNLDRNCKIFVSGSDQVWNPAGSMNPIYFLQFVNDQFYRASYAASMGVSRVPEIKRELFEKYIQRFDSVSVREEDVKSCVQEFYKGTIDVNVDPTLLMPKEFWEEQMNEVPNMPEKYILAYILHLPKNANRLLKWLQKETGAKIVLIDGQGAMTHLVKNDISLHNIGPKEFLWLVAHANSVVTSSFHGTAFSVIFQKEFYSIVNPAAPSRINSLLGLCGLQPVKETDMEFSRNILIDWTMVDAVLFREREKSADYIRRVYQKSETKFREPLKGTVLQVKERCTGCSACEAICPTNAISMKLNAEGFYEPRIDPQKCINCSKCIRKCPVDKKAGLYKKKSYYGWHKDPGVLFYSSSGGAMRALADQILKEGGVIFGAVFSDDWKSVVFTDSDHVEMNLLQKSKYTVSNPSGIFKKVREQLDSGRKVLFCGTPCQCAGLSSFLNKDYNNLVRCDFVCGGMSSLTFFREHLGYLESKYNSKIKSIDFRPKNKGWGKQRIRVVFENGEVYFVRSHLDTYFKCFANEHVSVRETCLDCQFYAYHISDITLADFWGYAAAGIKLNKKGMSLLVANTERGILAIENADDLELHDLELRYTDYAIKSKSPNPTKITQRNEFFKAAKQSNFEKAALDQCGVGEMAHIKAYIKLKLKL